MLGLKYILAIEGSIFDVRQGHTYRKDGEVHESRKSGMAQVKQLMTITRKDGVEGHYFNNRKEMAFWILEYFLACERTKVAKSPLSLSLLVEKKDAPFIKS